MKNYYYLVSSLPDLTHPRAETPFTLSLFDEFCREQMDAEDYQRLKLLYLFNDIKNVVHAAKEGSYYSSPSYYDEPEFHQNYSDPDFFLPFIARYLHNQNKNIREYPALLPSDELRLFLYDSLESYADGFVYDYYIFDADFRNICTALGNRIMKHPYDARIMPCGTVYEYLLNNHSADFGLPSVFPWVTRMVEAYRMPSLMDRELALEEIRWDWIALHTLDAGFTLHAVMAQALKTVSVERWRILDSNRGTELFERLLNTVKRSVRFSIEFSSRGEEQS